MQITFSSSGSVLFCGHTELPYRMNAANICAAMVSFLGTIYPAELPVGGNRYIFCARYRSACPPPSVLGVCVYVFYAHLLCIRRGKYAVYVSVCVVVVFSVRFPVSFLLRVLISFSLNAIPKKFFLGNCSVNCRCT